MFHQVRVKKEEKWMGNEQLSSFKELDRKFTNVYMVNEYQKFVIIVITKDGNLEHFMLNKKRHKVGIYAVRSVKQSATNNCFITHNNDLNAAKNIYQTFKFKKS
jgi:hypothetical protein